MIGFACPSHKERPLEIGLRAGSTRRIFKISQRRRAISAQREGTKRARARVCVYILLRHVAMSRGTNLGIPA